MASGSKPCQRCIKAKAECTISSSFRLGKPSVQKQGQSKRPLVVEGDDAGHSVGIRKRKSATTSLDGERGTPLPKDSGM